jgi:hypothetical protein
MNSTPLIDPGLSDSIAAISAPSTCKIQRMSGPTQDAYGAPLSGATGTPGGKQTWTDLPGHGALPCRIAPEYQGSLRGTKEVRAKDFVQEWNDFQCDLFGYFPQILQKDKAVVDGSEYQITGIDFDGNKAITHLHLRTLTV